MGAAVLYFWPFTNALRLRDLEASRQIRRLDLAIKVTIRAGEPGERFLQRFKRICSKDGLFKEIKKRSYYEKPSEKKRRRAKDAQRALRKRIARAERARKGT